MRHPCDDNHDCRPYFNVDANYHGVLHDRRCPNHVLNLDLDGLNDFLHGPWNRINDHLSARPADDDAAEYDANNARLLDYGTLDYVTAHICGLDCAHNGCAYFRSYGEQQQPRGIIDHDPGYGEDAASAAQHIVWGYPDWRFA